MEKGDLQALASLEALNMLYEATIGIISRLVQVRGLEQSTGAILQRTVIFGKASFSNSQDENHNNTVHITSGTDIQILIRLKKWI